MCNNQSYQNRWNAFHNYHYGRHPQKHFGKRPGMWSERSQMPVNVKELDNQYEIQVFAPGYKKEDFKLSIVDDKLTLLIKPESTEQEETVWQHREFGVQSKKRVFKLNEKIDKEHIEASYAEGVLTITLKKLEAFETWRSDITVV